MSIAETTVTTFDADIRDKLPVLVEYWAPWCGPCRALAPSVEQLAVDYAGRLKVLKLNMDESTDAWSRFEVRGIPALVFYVDGKEVGRCTGPSTIRLRTMVRKWLGESGSGASIPSGEPSDRPETRTDRSERNWCSFGGGDDVKAGCVARWRNAPPTVRSRPLSVLSLDGDADRFEATVGIPSGLGRLLNVMWDLATGFDNPFEENPNAHRQMREWIEALPVGADLSVVAAGVLHDFMCMSPWKMTLHFDGAALELAERIALLHAREHAGESIPAAQREGLQREAVLLVGGGGQDEENMSERLESLTYSLHHESAGLEVFTIIRLRVDGFSRAGNWTPIEETRIREIKRQNESLAVAALGPRPKDDSEGHAWHLALLQRVNELNQQSRVRFPELWFRHDAVVAYEKKVSREIAAYLAARFLTRVHAAPQVAS
ncbi:thioredoxin [Burkholderia metallica]|uniref:thioredoxin family protein n=1 Tax=Burkholderia metallica TaxID=488729 RepID=UPI00157B6BA1|nr:thioredoxin family protein [Burkholderia metallica]NTZ83619.1 thioredoxin [Burkholderia metallica]